MRIDISKRTEKKDSALKLIDTISKHFRISEKTAELIVSRGIFSIEECQRFLFFSKDGLTDPYLLSSMDKVVDRIHLAVKKGEKIVVFGDYDADGICGTYILVKSILELGGNVFPYIPNRSEGYGLNIQALTEIMDSVSPDLIITCDLGISCFEEIEFIKSKGVDVLVTDHHELPKILPDCVKLNPKLDEGRYPDIDLCGAGVAFKISQALLPNKFMDYVEFACIATVADSVPLKGENRLIVKLGLEKMRNNPSKSLKILMSECGIKGELTSMTIAFVIAPRINASGRMGVAQRSLNMFLSENEKEIKTLVAEINSDNLLRQKMCEQYFIEGYQEFCKNPERRACILTRENWQSGLLGIVASKLSEEFSRPTFLFSSGEGTLRGSGRSIEGINMFEMLSSMSELFITFGGHAQACGLTIAKDKFIEFLERVEEYLLKNVPIENFLPKARFDISEKEIKPTLGFLKELSVLEPYGVGNPRPIFLREEFNIPMEEMKNYPQHLVGTGDYSELLAFSQGKYVDVMRSAYKKALLVDYSINSFRGKESIKGSIKEFFTVIDELSLSSEEELKNFLFSRKPTQLPTMSEEDYIELIAKNKFGILTVCSTTEGKDKLLSLINREDFLFEANAIVVKSNVNKVLLSPKSTINFDKFDKIIFVEEGTAVDVEEFSSKVYSLSGFDYLRSVTTQADREVFGKIFKELRRLNNQRALSYNDILNHIKIKNIVALDIMIAYAVFAELKLIRIENGKLKFDSDKKVELNSSKLFCMLNDKKI